MEFKYHFELKAVNPRKRKKEEVVEADLTFHGRVELSFLDDLVPGQDSDSAFLELWGEEPHYVRHPTITWIHLDREIWRTVEIERLQFHGARLRKWRIAPETAGAYVHFQLTLEPQDHLDWLCGCIGDELMLRVSDPQRGLFDGQEPEGATG